MDAQVPLPTLPPAPAPQNFILPSLQPQFEKLFGQEEVAGYQPKPDDVDYPARLERLAATGARSETPPALTAALEDTGDSGDTNVCDSAPLDSCINHRLMRAICLRVLA